MPKHHPFARLTDLHGTCSKRFVEDEHDEETDTRRGCTLFEREHRDERRKLRLKLPGPPQSRSCLRWRCGVQRVERRRDHAIADERGSHHVGSV
jgi:hypothetical protein